MSKDAAVKGLRAVIAGISLGTSDNYHFDLHDRVLPSVVYPSGIDQVYPGMTSEASPWYYVCVPLDGSDTPNPDNYGFKFTIPAIAFLGETSYDPRTTEESTFICNLQDDIKRRVEKNPSLGGTCVNCLWMGARSRAGWPTKSQRYGELHMLFEIEQFLEG